MMDEKTKQRVILDMIALERNRQDLEWGVQRHDAYKWLAILSEEMGEVANTILNEKRNEMVYELVQCGATIVAWLESLMEEDGMIRLFDKLELEIAKTIGLEEK